MANITMKDVAKKAGVSRQAASIAFNNTPTTMVSQATRAKIFKAARELNYRPNHFAQSLKTGRTNIIGITSSGGILRQFNEPYIASVYEGIGRYFYDTDYKLIFQSFPNLSAKDPLNEWVSGRIVDGLIYLIFSNEIDNFRDNKIPALKKSGIPFVVIHSIQEDLGVPAVGVDCVKGGYEGTKHLAGLGHDSIGFVNYEGTMIHGQNLYQGYTKALKEYNIFLNGSSVYGVPGVDYRDGYNLADTLVKNKASLPRAFFVAEEKIAFGMIKRFTQAGLRVPEDVAIMGFGNIRSEALQLTGLTVVTQPAEEKGRLAAEMLTSIIKAPETKPGLKLVEPELKIRTSCGK